MIDRIYLDLDDVLNQFTMYALNAVTGGLQLGLDQTQYDPDWKYDIVLAANRIKERMIGRSSWHRQNAQCNLSSKEFWSMIDEGIWATIPKSRECDLLIKLASSLVGEDGVFILSTSINESCCLSGKMKWLKTYLPPWLHGKYIFVANGCSKSHLADSRSLLIDDSDRNCGEFSDAGGHSIVFPRPWNSMHGVAFNGLGVTYLHKIIESIRHTYGFPLNIH